jgi:hypothetical protein
MGTKCLNQFLSNQLIPNTPRTITSNPDHLVKSQKPTFHEAGKGVPSPAA